MTATKISTGYLINLMLILDTLLLIICWNIPRHISLARNTHTDACIL